jgi:lipoyl-dependent peroxiredoxin
LDFAPYLAAKINPSQMKRKGTAVWNGSGKDGKGHVSSQSTALNKIQYSYKSRFEEGVGTNPEELIAAAHASCFAMKLSFVLQEAGFTADEINAESAITFENSVVTQSDLTVRAKVPGITAEKFQEAAKSAKENCPISKLLSNIKITVTATLA